LVNIILPSTSKSSMRPLPCRLSRPIFCRYFSCHPCVLHIALNLVSYTVELVIWCWRRRTLGWAHQSFSSGVPTSFCCRPVCRHPAEAEASSVLLSPIRERSRWQKKDWCGSVPVGSWSQSSPSGHASAIRGWCNRPQHEWTQSRPTAAARNITLSTSSPLSKQWHVLKWRYMDKWRYSSTDS
jgi:hypothetical protein